MGSGCLYRWISRIYTAIFKACFWRSHKTWVAGNVGT